jgi:hypothetical protein
MKLPQDLSGERLEGGLCRAWGHHRYTKWAVPHSRNEEPKQRLAIPLHQSLRVGTLGNILRAVASHKGISKEQILQSIL